MAPDKEFTAKAMKNISELHSLHDLVLIAGADQQKFSVHWLVIAAACNLFKTSAKPEKCARYTCPKVNGSTLKMVIDYCYSGHIQLTFDNVGAVTTAASSLGIVDLNQKCAQFSQTNLNVENCVEQLLRAVRFKFPTEKLLEFMRERFVAVPIAQLVRMDVIHLRELLCYERLTAPEAYIFDVMVQWVEHNETDRAKHVPDLLKCIRLKHVPSQFLNSTVEPFFAKHNCRELLFVELMGRALKEPASLHRFPTHSIDEAGKNIYGAFSTPTPEGTIVEVQKYNFVANEWEPFKTATFKTPMQEYGLAIIGDKIFAMGGQSQAKAPSGWAEICFSNKAWSYNMSTGKTMKLADLHHGRSHFTPVVIGNCIYLIGGRESSDRFRNAQHTDARYSAAVDAWNPYSKEMPSKKRWASIAVDGEIFVLADCEFYRYDKNQEPYASMFWKCSLDKYYGDVILATAKQIIYAIRDDGVVYQYDDKPNPETWKMIGAFKNGEIILRTIDYNGEMYAIYKATKWGEYRFGKITIAPQNCIVTPLTALPDSLDSSSILFLR